jgi:P-type Ca2+ transporter type 2C
MNWIALAELRLAVVVVVAQRELFNRLLDTVLPKAGQFGPALVAAVLLLALWEVGKTIARRRSSAGPASGLCSPAAPARTAAGP